MMKSFLSGIAVAVIIGGAVLAITTKPVNVNVPPAPQPVLGASSGPDHYNTEQFFQGFSFPNAAKSSSSPALLKDSAAFFMTGTTTAQNASSTLIGANSMVFWQFASTTPIAGTTCNLGAPATSTISIFASSTSSTISGFQFKFAAAPSGSTAPYCIQGFITPNK